VCCSVLQCVAVCCSVLQCVAAYRGAHIAWCSHQLVCVCVCVCDRDTDIDATHTHSARAHTHTHTHIHTHVHANTHARAHKHTHIRTCMHTHTHTCVASAAGSSGAAGAGTGCSALGAAALTASGVEAGLVCVAKCDKCVKIDLCKSKETYINSKETYNRDLLVIPDRAGLCSSGNLRFTNLHFLKRDLYKLKRDLQ